MGFVEESDLQLLKLVYYGVNLSSIDETKGINENSNLFTILKEYSSIIYKLDKKGANQQIKQVIPVRDLDSDNKLTEDEYIAAAALNNHNLELIEEIEQSINSILKFSEIVVSDYEILTFNAVLGHLFFLINDNEKSLYFLNKLEKISNINIEHSEFDILHNYFIAWDFLGKTLRFIITRDIKIINEPSFEIPIFSNFKAKFWFGNFTAEFFLQLTSNNQSALKFSQLRETISNEKLLLVVCLVYYDKENQDEEFSKFFRDYIDKKYFNNKSLKFPNSHECDAVEKEYALFVYWIVSWNSHGLISNAYLEELNEFLISKTYHSIYTHYSLIVLKIDMFQKSNNISDTNLEAKFGKVNEILAIMQNFEDFYEKSKIKAIKKNDDSDVGIEFNDLLIVNLYSKFIDFFVKISQVNYGLLESVSPVRTNMKKIKELKKYYRLYELGNLHYLDNITEKLTALLDGITKHLKIATNSFQIYSVSHLSGDSITNIFLSKGYHLLTNKKVFSLKTNSQNELQDFLDKQVNDSENVIDMMILSDFQKCVNLNEFNDLDFYFDLVVFLLRFYKFDKFGKLILSIVKTGLKKNINYWKFWNLLLILVNSNYGILFSSVFNGRTRNTDTEEDDIDDENLSINKIINNLIHKYLSENKNCINRIPVETKKDLIQLKFTQLVSLDYGNNGLSSLLKINELFELFNDLFDIENDHTITDNSSRTMTPKERSLTVKTNNMSSGALNGTGISIFRFNTFKRNSRQVIKGKSNLNAKTVKNDVPKTISEKVGCCNESISDNKMVQRMILSEIWVFISKLYFENSLYKESEETIKEAIDSYCSLNAYNQTVKLSNKLNKNTVDDVYIQEYINSSAKLNCLYYGELIIDYTKDILSKELLKDTVPSEKEQKLKDKCYINDLIFISDPNMKEEEDSLLGTLSLNDLNINGSTNSLAKLTSDQIVDEIKLLRCKSLLEDNLIDNYYYFNNLDLWNCLAKIYLKLNDMTKYEYALKKVIHAEESSLIRNLNCL